MATQQSTTGSKTLVDFSQLKPDEQKRYWKEHQLEQQEAINEKLAKKGKQRLDDYRARNVT